MSELDPVAEKLFSYIDERASAQDKADKLFYALFFLMMLINASISGANLWVSYKGVQIQTNGEPHSASVSADAPSEGPQ